VSSIRSHRRLTRAPALAAFAASLLAAATSHAYVMRTTASGLPVHWPDDSVALELDPSLVNGVPGALAALEQAASGWTESGGGPRLSVALADTSSSPAVDGRNVVYWSPTGYPGMGAALAVTLVSFDETTGEILDADVVLDGRYDFAVLAPSALPSRGAAPVASDPFAVAADVPSGGQGDLLGLTDLGAAAAPFDLVHVLAHETGHALGLRDAAEDASDVMYLYTMPGDARRRAPDADDAAGVAALYAGVPLAAAHGCGSSSLAPSRPPAGHAWVATSLGLTLLCGVRLLVRRRRAPVLARHHPRRPTPR